ncbi:MAG: DNA translocase FtsK [Clostridiales bacterium]|nr:DNA translocase FtsK [Clostridiales bacterium]
MDERYEILAQDGVRNIITYNENHKNNPMNNIVVIIDKYLEYTYEMPSDFIECIKEIARKGRAAGIHLIINAQSARSEVVNNDVKANMPCRIAFSVTDWHESKAILDKTGAQKLLGNGDMLYSPSLTGNPQHIQAPYVSLKEIEAVVSDVIQRNGVAEYVRDFDDVREPVEDNVPYVISILERLLQVNTVDVYSLQDMLDISYAEASDIIKFMEFNGVVSGYDAGKGRNVNHAQIESLLGEFKSLNSVPDEDDQN